MTKSVASEKQIISDDGPDIGDYFQLMKPRVMSLVVFTALVGLILAPGHIHPIISFSAILFVSIGAGSAAAINMWYDRDIDRIMQRTQQRPTVTGRISAEAALSFGIITAVASVLLMAICVNLVSASLLLLTIIYYIFIYTMWLKRSSVQNVVIGGAAGAFPPMIGWASVTGDVNWASFSLFLIIFLWTPPHSWALAIFRVKDYQNCNVPMMPAVRGLRYTNWQILLYTILMITSSYLPYVNSITSEHYLAVASIANLGFIYYVYRLFTASGEEVICSSAKKLFIYSIFYLFILFLALMVISPFIQ